MPRVASAPDLRPKRLQILEEPERAALFDRPQFTDEERPYYVGLTPTELAHMQTFEEGVIQAWFVLQLEYFKASQRFFPLNNFAEVHADVTFYFGPA